MPNFYSSQKSLHPTARPPARRPPRTRTAAATRTARTTPRRTPRRRTAAARAPAAPPTVARATPTARRSAGCRVQKDLPTAWRSTEYGGENSWWIDLLFSYVLQLFKFFGAFSWLLVNMEGKIPDESTSFYLIHRNYKDFAYNISPSQEKYLPSLLTFLLICNVLCCTFYKGTFKLNWWYVPVHIVILNFMKK